MSDLIIKVRELRDSSVRDLVERRLEEFSSFSDKPISEWFSELCFCILTANSKAHTGLKIQAELGSDGFLDLSQEEIRDSIIRNKHRFHNNKSRYIVLAREHSDVRDKIVGMSEMEAREWLVENIKGIGYKEASHFLRNVGYFGVAILDRHILNLFLEHGYLDEKPVSLNRKKYLEIERVFNEIASRLGMSSAELDLYMWYLKTGEVLK